LIEHFETIFAGIVIETDSDIFFIGTSLKRSFNHLHTFYGGFCPAKSEPKPKKVFFRPIDIWNVSGGQKVSNVHTAVRLVIHIVFRLGCACLNVVNASAKSALQRAQLCTKHGNLCRFGFGQRIW